MSPFGFDRVRRPDATRVRHVDACAMLGGEGLSDQHFTGT
jgi:hypothetical protein